MMKRYLGATALVLVLGAPAYAQTTIGQFTDVGGVLQDQSNSIVVNAPGVSATAVGSQTIRNEANVVGPTAFVGVSDQFTIEQGAGVAPGQVTGPVTQSATNVISANGITPSVVANVVAGGNQSAGNVVNSVNVVPLANATGSIVQNSTGSTLTATNAMSATVQNGNSVVNGSNGSSAGFQNAFGTINTVGLSVTTGATVALDQKLGGVNSVTATNSAVANTIASGSTTLDPAVQNIAQTSQIGVNQAAVSGAGTTVLTGGQSTLGGLETNLTFGNTAVGYTGAVGSPTYGIGSAAPGNGVAVVSGVTQQASLGLNNVEGGAGVNLSLDPGAVALGAGFTQSTDGTDITVATPTGNLPNVVNGMAARTNEGSATISGVARTQASDAFTQSLSNQQNTLSTGGTLSGTLTQSASNVTQGGAAAGGYVTPGLTNAVVAEANVGPGAINNVSQNANQSFNAASGVGTGTGLTLNQTATNLTVGNGNVQVASGTNSANISGAVQLSSLSANTATLGAASGTITQTSGNITLAGSNQLGSSTSYNSSVSGVQQATSSVNVIK